MRRKKINSTDNYIIHSCYENFLTGTVRYGQFGLYTLNKHGGEAASDWENILITACEEVEVIQQEQWKGEEEPVRAGLKSRLG